MLIHCLKLEQQKPNEFGMINFQQKVISFPSIKIELKKIGVQQDLNQIPPTCTDGNRYILTIGSL